MNADPVPARRSRWGRLLLWFAIAVAASVLVLAWTVVDALTLSRDARRLRDALVAAAPVRPTPHIQISAGPATIAAARIALRCIDDVPEEARLAVRAVRSASVGVYEVDHATGQALRRQWFDVGDRVLGSHGWTRLVGVRDHDDVVMVYVPGSGRIGGAQRVCLAVCHGKELVIVSGVADTDALLALLERQGHWPVL